MKKDCEKERERVRGRWTKLEHEQLILDCSSTARTGKNRGPPRHPQQHADTLPSAEILHQDQEGGRARRKALARSAPQSLILPLQDSGQAERRKRLRLLRAPG